MQKQQQKPEEISWGIGAPPAGWPTPMSADAMHGITGDLVDIVGPQTESDPAALVLNNHLAFGNIVGPGPHVRVEADRHSLNIFVAEVGATAKARKGTGWGRVMDVYKRVEPAWAEERVQPGARTGEGLIRSLADETGDAAGVSDKRLLLIESEMGGTLRVMGRPGNSLSMILRQAWDGGTLQVLTRKSPLRATKPHISILFHTTHHDLSRYLDQTDVFNGFGNRPIWAAVRRSKLLPEGGRIPEKSLARIARAIADAVEFARKVREIKLSERSRYLWRERYPELTADVPGMLGAVTSRAESQVLRLAAIYALLDRKDVILTQHLKAALAVWQFCFASARYIFGDRSAVTLDDRLLQVLQKTSTGLTRTGLSAALYRHVGGGEIRRALDRLQRKGLVAPRKENTRGRSAERWLAVEPKQQATKQRRRSQSKGEQ